MNCRRIRSDGYESGYFSSGFHRDAGRWVLLDAQLDRLRNYCSFKGLEIAKEFTFVESSFHGKRTKFYEAVNYIKRQSKLTALVVDTVDRLQRTFNEFPIFLELVKKKNWLFTSLKKG
ncbi:MAG: recombinase family protein [Alphaproteobacteria bacterium]